MSSVEHDRRLFTDWQPGWIVAPERNCWRLASGNPAESGIARAPANPQVASHSLPFVAVASTEFQPPAGPSGSAGVALHADAALGWTDGALRSDAGSVDLDELVSFHAAMAVAGFVDLSAVGLPGPGSAAPGAVVGGDAATFEVAAPALPALVPTGRSAATRTILADPALDKLDGFLASLVSGRAAHAVQLPAALPGSIDGTYVTIDATARDGDGAALLAELRVLGLAHGAAFGGMASGEMPIARLGALQHLADLSFAQEDALVADKVSPLPPQVAEALGMGKTSSGVVTTQGGQTIDGAGITVGILSDSFNTSGGADTMQTDIAKGYLPADTHILEDYPGGTDEGRALAEIVHEVAPGAAILFATAFDGEASFADNIIALARAGAKVIVDDVGYYDEPAYQDGVIAQAVDYVTSQLGVTYLSAAGNDGGNGYEGRFTRGVHAGGRIFENFTPGHGQHDAIPVTIPGGDEVVSVLEWAQPAASASPRHGATGELDLLLETAGGRVIAQSHTHTIGHDPFQAIDYVNQLAHARILYLKVAWAAGAVPKDFKLMALDDGAGATLGNALTNGSNKNHGTIYGHPAAAGAVSVGADFIGDTPAFGTDPPVSESYSSTGPTDIYFRPNGTPLATPTLRAGPDLMAPDGADTSFFGFQIDDGDNLPNFFGTSAAAPAAAAVDALVLQADPLLSAGQAVDIIESTALHQPDSVSGLVQANVAVNLAWDLYT